MLIPVPTPLLPIPVRCATRLCAAHATHRVTPHAVATGPFDLCRRHAEHALYDGGAAYRIRPDGYGWTMLLADLLAHAGHRHLAARR
jgi:hypothetical protein